jgi:hypothetical protein
MSVTVVVKVVTEVFKNVTLATVDSKTNTIIKVRGETVTRASHNAFIEIAQRLNAPPTMFNKREYREIYTKDDYKRITNISLNCLNKKLYVQVLSAIETRIQLWHSAHAKLSNTEAKRIACDYNAILEFAKHIK